MAKRKKKVMHTSVNTNTPPHKLYPAVSVVIPMYNAEKFIGDCLNSILTQTFTNFEVIIVDDCSTDSSCAIVESFIPKFGGRLTLSHMKKNSGKPSLPRNKGLLVSGGEYIFFMDNDDLITPTAFEELYTLAKKYDADVVYCEKYYEANENNVIVRPTESRKKVFVDKPTFESDLLSARIDKVLKDLFPPMPWVYFMRRDLLTENEIFFPNIIRDDSIWSWHMIFCAKKILCVPNAIYYWRTVKTSITRSSRTPIQDINFWLNPIILGMKNWNEVLSSMEFFQKNSFHHYVMLNHFIMGSFACLFGKSFQLPPFAVYEAIKQEFGDRLGEYDVLIPALCTIINTLQKIQAINNQKFNEFAEQAQRRIAELEKQLQSVRK